MSLRFFSKFLKHFDTVKEVPHNQQLTSFLSSNPHFVKSCLKVHDMKTKFWQKLDEAAFPEDYEVKNIENNSQKTEQKRK